MKNYEGNEIGNIVFTHEIQFGKVSYQAVKISENQYDIFENGYPLGAITNNGVCWVKKTTLQYQSKPYDQVIIYPVK